MGILNKQVDFEIKQVTEDTDFFRFEGFASTFGNTDLDDDIIIAGAFSESLKERTPLILWQHDTREPIGMPEEIFETSEGLILKGKLPKADTLVTGRIIPQIKIGSIRSMSIGFSIDGPDGSVMRGDGVRIITKVKLFEVSLVSFPANPMATVSNFKVKPTDNDDGEDTPKKTVEKMTKLTVEDIEEIETVRELENCLKNTGAFTVKASKMLISKFSGLKRDAENQKDEKKRDAGNVETTNCQREAEETITLLKDLTEKCRGQGHASESRKRSASSG